MRVTCEHCGSKLATATDKPGCTTIECPDVHDGRFYLSGGRRGIWRGRLERWIAFGRWYAKTRFEVRTSY